MNEKNSWSLDLIDHMGRDINEASGDGGQGITNFQRAAGTLEAGIKIYSYRVDSVYTETFKLMGGLNRTSKRDGQGVSVVLPVDEAELHRRGLSASLLVYKDKHFLKLKTAEMEGRLVV